MLSYPTTHKPRQYRSVINKVRKELYGSDLEAVYLMSIFSNTNGIAGNFIKVKLELINLRKLVILFGCINVILITIVILVFIFLIK